MKLDRMTIAAAVLTCVTVAQQPNVGGVSLMTIDGIDGPPYPVEVNVRTSTTATFQIQGLTNAQFSIVRSATGAVAPGAATYFGDSYDLPLSPPHVVCLDGIANPAFNTGMSGVFSFPVNVPPPGTPPAGIALGFTAAYQTAIIDYFSPYNWSLTAATRATVIQGPTVVNMNTGIGGWGSSGVTTVNLSTFGLSLPFYGVNYTTLHISGDGYMTFGGGQLADFTPSDVEMNTGPPRIAGFWCDLDQQPGSIVRYTVDATPPGSIPGFVFVEFLNVMDAVTGNLHNFNWKIDTLGFVQIAHLTTNSASIYDTVVGIGPGNGLGMPQPQKNFIGTQPPGSSVGAGILSTPPYAYNGNVNENFFEWFGIISLHAYYTNPYDNPYDIPGITLHFLPQGSGSLPGSTNRYVLY